MATAGLTHKGIARRMLAVCVVLLAALVFPAGAWAAQPTYSIDALDTELTVETDASVHVVHRQTITFSRPNEGLVWYLHEPETRESVKIASLRIAPVDDTGALAQEWTSLQLVDFNPETQGLRPGDSANSDLRAEDIQPWYSFNVSDGFVRAYFPADSGTYLVETDYVVVNRIRVFRDVGELYWRYADSDMPVDASNATMKVALPVPAGTAVVPNDTVLAWGHGPQSGTFVIGEDGSVTYHVDLVMAGQYAEGHVLFPASWLPNVSRTSPQYRTELRRDYAVAEEAEWLDANARASIWDNQVRGLFGIVAVVAIVLAIILVAVQGRTPRARRSLVRIAVTLFVIAVAEQLFFKEPLTTGLLLAIVVVLAFAAACLPYRAEELIEEVQEDAHE